MTIHIKILFLSMLTVACLQGMETKKPALKEDKSKDPLELAQYAYMYNNIEVCKEHVNKITPEYFDNLPEKKQPKALYEMGQLLFKLKDFVHAKIYLKEASKLGDKNAHYFLGKISFLQQLDVPQETMPSDETKDTITHLQNYITAQQDNRQNRIRKAYYMLGKSHAKNTMYCFAQAAKKGEPQAAFELGQIYEGQGQLQEAVTYFKRVQECETKIKEEKEEPKKPSLLSKAAEERLLKLKLSQLS